MLFGVIYVVILHMICLSFMVQRILSPEGNIPSFSFRNMSIREVEILLKRPLKVVIRGWKNLCIEQ